MSSTATMRTERVRGRRAYLSPQEVAELLGVSQWTIYRMVYNGELGSRKIGRLRRIPVGDVLKLAPELSELV